MCKFMKSKWRDIKLLIALYTGITLSFLILYIIITNEIKSRIIVSILLVIYITYLIRTYKPIKVTVKEVGSIAT